MSLVRFVASSIPRRNPVVSNGRSQEGHLRLSALNHLTVSLICLPHLGHVISSGKLSKNDIVLFTECTKLLDLASLVPRRPLQILYPLFSEDTIPSNPRRIPRPTVLI